MSFNALRDAIETTLDGISNIQRVYNYPTVPEEFPGATITPSDAEADYETTDENKRFYTFVITLYYRHGGSVKISDAVDALESLVDEVVDTFDQDPQLTSASLSMPSRYTMIQLVPTPSVWGYFEEHITAEIRLQAFVSYDAS